MSVYINKDIYFERTLAAYGKNTQDKLQKMKVLVVNMRGVGSEIAKNMALSSPNLLTIIDENKITEDDFSFNWFVQKSDLGKIRSTVMKQYLLEMNPFNTITEGSYDYLTDEYIKQYDQMIATDILDKEQLENWNNICRQNKVAFIASGCIGFFGWLFVDLNEIKVVDRMFHNEISHFYIEKITNDNPGKVTLINKLKPHYFQDGDFVTIDEVEGMNEVNGLEPRPIKVLDNYSFTIEDTTMFGKYIKGGFLSQEKVPFTRKYKDLRSNWETPSLQQTMSVEKNKIDLELMNHIAFLAYLKYQTLKNYMQMCEKNSYSRINGPRVNLSQECLEKGVKHFRDKEDATIVKEFLDQLVKDCDISQGFIEEYQFKMDGIINILKQLVTCSGGFQFQPLAVIIGNMSSLEMIKLTGKFMPIKQFSYVNLSDTFTKDFVEFSLQRGFTGLKKYYIKEFFDYMSIVKDTEGKALIESVQKQNVKDLRSLKILCITSGSKTMELLKQLILMGIAQNGEVKIIDNSRLKAESLNTNFIARIEDLGEHKCSAQYKRIKQIGVDDYPIECILDHMIYGDQDIEKKEQQLRECDIIFSGLDNEDSNLQVVNLAKKFGKACLIASSPNLDVHSHSLFPGFEENIEAVELLLKDRIKEGSLTLDSQQLKFPYLREHTVQWAMETYRLHFNKLYDELHDLKENQEKFINRIKAIQISKGWNIFVCHKLELIKRLFADDSVNNFADCVDIAIDAFLEQFNLSIIDLSYKYPEDKVKKDGFLFWTGMKRFPDVLKQDDEYEYTPQFLISTAKLYALFFHISIPNDGIIKDIVKTKIEGHICTTYQSTIELYGDSNFNDMIQSFIDQIIATKKFTARKFQNTKLNNKESHNVILNFIYSASALRSLNFKMVPIKKYKVEHQAFKVTPNIDIISSMMSANSLISMIRYFTVSFIWF